MRMPAEFFGRIAGTRASCGICGREVSVAVEKPASLLRAAGWTWRNDTGWTCTCRHQCGNLDPKQEPQIKRPRPRNRRHHYESAKQKKLRIRRNRQADE